MNWMEAAACATRPDLGWLHDADAIPAVVVDVMAELCSSCPVRPECEQYVVDQGICGGFWVGRDRSVSHAESLDGAA